MSIRGPTIEKLHEIIRRKYDREITLEQATEIASALVGYFDLLAKLHHQEMVGQEIINKIN